MKGVLKGKSAGNQLLIFIGITLASFFIIGLMSTVVLSQMLGVDLATMSDTTKWKASDPKIIGLIRGMQLVQFICLFIIPVFICARLFSTEPKKYLGLTAPSGNLYFLVGTALLLLAIPLTNYLGEINRTIQFPAGIETWMKAKEDEAARTIKILLSRRTIPDLLLNLIFIAVLAAVGEELVFRGIAQRLFIRIFKSPWAGIIVSAVLFSAMHMQFYGFFPRLLLGILLGALYWYSGSLWTAILAHFMYDAVLITIVYFVPATLDETQPELKSNLIWGALISLAAVVAILMWMKKNSDVRYPEIYADDAIPIKDHPF